MNPCKSADYFIKVNFRTVVDMKQGESKPFSRLIWKFYLIKNVFIMKNLTDSRKSIWGNWCGSAPEVIQDYTISLPFCFKELPAENKGI